MLKWRALLIIGALISLCLSDSVGPRLLPLPALQRVTASTEARQSIEPAGSPTPTPTKGLGPKVEMAAAPQNRAGAGDRQVQVATLALGGAFEAPGYTTLDVTAAYGPLLPFTALTSSPPGRAPHRLAYLDNNFYIPRARIRP